VEKSYTVESGKGEKGGKRFTTRFARDAEFAEKKVFPLAAETAGKRKPSLHFVPLGWAF
jgi:hypothetical protein